MLRFSIVAICEKNDNEFWVSVARFNISIGGLRNFNSS